jgi:uncharacterized metal-binding protein YceD (DUF177 family)
VRIEADAAERAALAALNRLPEIASFTATLDVKRASRGAVRVTGAVHAEFTQVCVVSLEPFDTTVDEAIEVRFAPAAEEHAPRRRSGEEDILSIGDEDEPDTILDGRIDLGALAAEFFALALDPYARKPGVAFEPAPIESEPDSPFAGLKGAAGSDSTSGGKRS